jgi:hypothetical protein
VSQGALPANRAGRRWARSGGHGVLLGDEGGAYWIGRSAVSVALRWEDGLGGLAAIRQAVTEAAGCQLAELVSKIHAHPAERSSLTRFAPVLTALAADDPVALSIAHQAARHLADLAGALRRRPAAGLRHGRRAHLARDLGQVRRTDRRRAPACPARDGGGAAGGVAAGGIHPRGKQHPQPDEHRR